MPVIVNGTTITDVKVNGTSISTVKVNSTTVFTTTLIKQWVLIGEHTSQSGYTPFYHITSDGEYPTAELMEQKFPAENYNVGHLGEIQWWDNFYVFQVQYVRPKLKAPTGSFAEKFIWDYSYGGNQAGGVVLFNINNPNTTPSILRITVSAFGTDVSNLFVNFDFSGNNYWNNNVPSNSTNLDIMGISESLAPDDITGFQFTFKFEPQAGYEEYDQSDPLTITIP